MEIKKQSLDDRVEIQVIGRMDGYWADHLGNALEEVIREGSHHVHLDLSQVPFMSSAGIRVLVKCYKQLQAIHGAFIITDSSEQVKKTIALSGLQDILLSSKRPAEGDTHCPTRRSATGQAQRTVREAGRNIRSFHACPRGRVDGASAR